MIASGEPSDMAFHVGEYVADELDARGWTTRYAASLMPGDPAVNELWLDLLTCDEIWQQHGGKILFKRSEAESLEKLLGVSAETLMNLHAAWMKTTANDS